MPEVSTDIFVWIPREQTTKYVIKINDVDVTDDTLSSEFSMAATTEVGSFKIVLENSNDAYSDAYVGGEDVELTLDFQDGDTTRFKGYVEKRKSVYKAGQYTLEVTGRHISGKLLERNVTYSATDTLISTILTAIIASDATELTSTNVNTTTDTATVNWENRPFWECVIDLCNLSGFDCYVDNDGDFHFFLAGSVHNSDEAIVWNDNLLEVSDLSEDTIDVINKVTVQGEGYYGSIILYTAENSASQTNIWVKEKVIIDSKINTMKEAQEVAEAELALTQPLSGEALSGILPSISPGETIWIDSPAQRIRNRYKIAKFTHRLPKEETKCVVEKVRKIPHIFRDRIQKEISLETILNPNNYNFSYNIFEFPGTETEVDTNIESSTGFTYGGSPSAKSYIFKASGEKTLITHSQTAPNGNNIEAFEVRIRGSALSNIVYKISLDEGITDQTIERNVKYDATETTGNKIKLEMVVDDDGTAQTQIDSLVILYRTE